MHEYKVVPAPGKAGKVKGLRSTADRFAHALAAVLNEHATQGWEFVRTETYTVEDKRGLFGRPVTTTQVVLILRRARVVRDAAPPLREAVPATVAPAPPLPASTAAAPEVSEAAPPPALAAADPVVTDLRAEPTFRAGALRAEGARKYPPLRRAGAEAAPDDGR